MSSERKIRNKRVQKRQIICLMREYSKREEERKNFKHTYKTMFHELARTFRLTCDFRMKGIDLTEQDIEDADIILFWMDDHLEVNFSSICNGIIYEQWAVWLYSKCAHYKTMIFPPYKDQVTKASSKIYYQELYGKVPCIPTEFITTDNIQEAKSILTRCFDQYKQLHLKRGYSCETKGHLRMNDLKELDVACEYVQDSLIRLGSKIILVQPHIDDFQEVKVLILDGKAVPEPKSLTYTELNHPEFISVADEVVKQLKTCKVFSDLPAFFRVDIVETAHLQSANKETTKRQFLLNEIETVGAEYTFPMHKTGEDGDKQQFLSRWKTNRLIQWHTSFIKSAIDKVQKQKTVHKKQKTS